MNPIYKFQLSAGNDTRQAFPVYKDDLAIDYALEQNQEFYRGKLSGKLTFQKDDYLFIRSKAFDTQFDVVISISYDGGQTWAVYWSGQFWKTDCQFNEDDQTAIVTPNVNDRYNAVLAGMEKEYNLIDLAPVIQPINLDKRPMLQAYVPGQSVIGCFLSGMWWEQECDAVSDTNRLINEFYFLLNVTKRIVDITQAGTPVLPPAFLGDVYTQNPGDSAEYVNGDYKFTFYKHTSDAASTFQIVRVSDNLVLWSYSGISTDVPQELVLQPVSGSGATGTVTIYIHDVSIYARYITDSETFGSNQTQEIPENDIVPNNRNYTRVIGFQGPQLFWFSTYLSDTPTKWGIYQPGKYYDDGIPETVGAGQAFPIARSAWTAVSIWYTFSVADIQLDMWGRKTFTLKDAFPIWSVISVLLAKIAPGITHDGTTDYSQFLYNTNPITGIDQRLFITPKSNVIASGYDQPAQKAPITLKRVTDMLRDCFRCYWFIDEQNRFRIEHISYFMRGGTYTGQPVVGIDLTQQIVTRNGKPWAYARNQYQFDKPEMAARYQFGWMDDVTELFDGYPIDIISKYVNPDNIEQIDVSQFTSDVDYILLNPGAVSKDGFVLLSGRMWGIRNTQFEQGGLSGTGRIGQNYESNKFDANNRIRTALIPVSFNQFYLYNFASGYTFAIQFYDENNLLMSFTSTTNTNTVFSVPDGCKNIAMVVFRSDNAPIAPNDALNIAGDFNSYKLPYVNFEINYSGHILQNAWVAFVFLQQYYMFDMPARNVQINGVTQMVRGIKKLKTQTIKFPVLTEPDMFNLIKTGLGNGTIQKMSVNLSSRNANATLKYDTE